MSVAQSVQHFLANRGVRYDLVPHAPTQHSVATARASHVHQDNLAKGILVRCGEGYLLAVLPASRKIRLSDLGAWLEKPVALATEAEVAKIFSDCEPGSVPPVAAAYGLPAVLDDSLEGFEHIYFEAGDHRTLVHVSGREFRRLMTEVPQAHISTSLH